MNDSWNATKTVAISYATNVLDELESDRDTTINIDQKLVLLLQEKKFKIMSSNYLLFW